MPICSYGGANCEAGPGAAGDSATVEAHEQQCHGKVAVPPAVREQERAGRKGWSLKQGSGSAAALRGRQAEATEQKKQRRKFLHEINRTELDKKREWNNKHCPRVWQ